MIPTRPMRRGNALALVLILLLGTPLAASDPIGPRVTRYDLATRGDLLLSRLVAPAMAGDVAEWSDVALGGLPGQVGGWVTRFLDANALAGVITEAFPIEGQPALGPVARLVADCARTLGLATPDVHVRNSPQARPYSVRSGDRHHIVLTSGLLALFEGRPGELKFVVGRELGHVACGHDGLRAKGYAVLTALRAVDAAVVPDKFQAALPTLALGRLFTWCREAEVSADRAGLLCCVEPKAAYQAIMRLQHGLRADSPWIDPASPDFDVEAALRAYRDWQYEPFVAFLLGIDAFIGGFVVYPDGGDGLEDGSGGRVADYTARILWDWKEPGSVSRPGHAKVRVRFSRRGVAVGGKPATSGEEQR